MGTTLFHTAGRLVVVALIAVGTVAPGVAAEKPPAIPKHTADEISRLIRQLSADRFADREAAARKLMEIDEARLPLEKSILAGDEDFVKRAGRIIDRLEARAVDRRLRRYLAYGKSGQIDRMIDGLSAWRGPADDPDCWQGVIDIAWDLVERANRVIGDEKKHLVFGNGGGCPPWSLKRLRDLHDLTFFPVERDLVVRRPFDRDGFSGFIRCSDLTVSGNPYWIRSVIVCSGDMTFCSKLSQSIVMVNGSNGWGPRLSGCIVVIDGDARLADTITNALVIARGDVGAKSLRYRNSAIVASGKVDANPFRKDETDSTVIQNSPKPLDFIRWFTPTVIGVGVDEVKSSARIKEVQPGTPAAKVQLRVGDLIMKIDGAKFESADSFRRLLRRGSVMDYCRVTVMRDGKPIDCWLDFLEDGLGSE